jgi:hypothetical protein
MSFCRHGPVTTWQDLPLDLHGTDETLRPCDRGGAFASLPVFSGFLALDPAHDRENVMVAPFRAS